MGVPRINRATGLAVAVVCAAVIAPAGRSDAQSAGPGNIKAFFGTYEGMGSTRLGRSLSTQNRDLDVAIQGVGSGFSLTSSLRLRGGAYSQDKKSETVTTTFVPANTPNTWVAQSSRPITEGGPTIVARLRRNVLAVHVLVILPDGRLATALYQRRLTRRGMSLIYRRSINGRIVRMVFATLRKTE